MHEKLLTPLVLLTALVTAGALFAILASAQVDAVETELRVNDIEPEPAWSGETLTRNIEIMLCYGVGGANPQGGDFLINITIDAPQWVNVTQPETAAMTPPLGPTVEAACMEPTAVEVQLTAPEGIPGNETFQATIQLRAEAETDAAGQSTTGTYAAPAATQASFEVTSVAPPQEPPPEEPEQENEDSPAVPILVVVLGTLALLAWARRL